MLNEYEVHYYVPGVGHLGERIFASDDGAAARAVLARYPNAQINYIKKLN